MADLAPPTLARAAQLWHLKGFDLFRELDPAEQVSLERSSRLRRLRRGELLYRHGDPADQVFALRRGFIRLVALSDEGREATLALLGEGEVFGELEVMEGTERPHSSVAGADSELFALPRRHFLALMQRPRSSPSRSASASAGASSASTARSPACSSRARNPASPSCCSSWASATVSPPPRGLACATVSRTASSQASSGWPARR
jgi:hypothetical protein